MSADPSSSSHRSLSSWDYRNLGNFFSCQGRFVGNTFYLGKAPFRTFKSSEFSYVPVYVHMFWFFFWLLATIISFKRSVDFAIAISIVIGPLLLISMIIHELGRMAAIVHLGGKIEKMILTPLGSLKTHEINMNKEIFDNQPGKVALIAMAGPLTHIPQAVMWIFFLFTAAISKDFRWARNREEILCEEGIGVQIHLLFVTLFPAYPLDGSLLLFSILQYCLRCDQSKAWRITALIGGVSTLSPCTPFRLFRFPLSSSSDNWKLSIRRISPPLALLVHCVPIHPYELLRTLPGALRAAYRRRRLPERVLVLVVVVPVLRPFTTWQWQ